jgi:hypothetical protein
MSQDCMRRRSEHNAPGQVRDTGPSLEEMLVSDWRGRPHQSSLRITMPRKPRQASYTRIFSLDIIRYIHLRAGFVLRTVVALLLPIRRQYRLNILRPLGDRLIPGQTILACETCHGLNELLHLIVE